MAGSRWRGEPKVLRRVTRDTPPPPAKTKAHRQVNTLLVINTHFAHFGGGGRGKSASGALSQLAPHFLSQAGVTLGTPSLSAQRPFSVP